MKSKIKLIAGLIISFLFIAGCKGIVYPFDGDPSNAIVKVKSVEISNAIKLEVGNTKTLTATIIPSDATNQGVTWKSDNKAVAKVDDSGKVTAVSAGTATITVTTDDGGHTDSCTINVINDEPEIGETDISTFGIISDLNVWNESEKWPLIPDQDGNTYYYDFPSVDEERICNFKLAGTSNNGVGCQYGIIDGGHLELNSPTPLSLVSNNYESGRVSISLNSNTSYRLSFSQDVSGVVSVTLTENINFGEMRFYILEHNEGIWNLSLVDNNWCLDFIADNTRMDFYATYKSNFYYCGDAEVHVGYSTVLSRDETYHASSLVGLISGAAYRITLQDNHDGTMTALLSQLSAISIYNINLNDYLTYSDIIQKEDPYDSTGEYYYGRNFDISDVFADGLPQKGDMVVVHTKFTSDRNISSLLFRLKDDSPAANCFMRLTDDQVVGYNSGEYFELELTFRLIESPVEKVVLWMGYSYLVLDEETTIFPYN